MPSPHPSSHPSSHTRRRQRSVRLTFSVLLIVCAALIVGAAVLDGSATWLAVAAAIGVICGAVATRLTYVELVESRINAGRGRAELTQEFLALTVARTAENDEFQVAMIERIRRREVAVAELESALTAAQHRAAEAIRKRNAEVARADAAEAAALLTTVCLDDAEQRAAEAVVRVAELESEAGQIRDELVAVRAELAVAKTDLDTAHAEVAAWQAAGPVRKRA
jgi:hypothetical protein